MKRTNRTRVTTEPAPRRSLDLQQADLTALADAAEILLRESESFIELPGPLNWAPVAFAALALEREMMTLTPDLAQREHADAVLPLYGACATAKALPFRELWVLLKEARPDPTGCGEQAGGIWVPGPDNLQDACAVAQCLRPIIGRLQLLKRSQRPRKEKQRLFLHSERTRQILALLHGKSKKLAQLAELLNVTEQQLSGRELKELRGAGLIRWHRRIGYYRPDAPPADIVVP